MIALAVRLLRHGGRRAATSAALVAAAVAVGTTLLAITLGALHGWDARQDRIGWRLADARTLAGTAPVAMMSRHDDVVAGQRFSVVDLAAARPGAAPPPGLDHVPAPGEVYLSPALAELAARLPADRLAQRFPAPVTGTISAAGLLGPGEMVAIVGRSAPVGDAAPIAGFAPRPGDLSVLEGEKQLTIVAVALLLFPVLSLFTAAARLSAARRAERLATLRLLGASTGQVTVVATTEVVLVAAAAAIAGAALQWLLAPLLASIPLGGATWFVADLRPSLAVTLATVVGGTGLAGLAAVGGMRQVVVSPLGVVRRQRPGRVRLARLAGAAVALAGFVAVDVATQSGSVAVAAFGVFFGGGVLCLYGVISLVGPLVVRLLGRSMTAGAASPARLIAGRRLLDDPKAAFRPLAGLTLAVFVAGIFAPVAGLAGAAVPDSTSSAIRLRDVSAEQVTAALAPAGIAPQLTSERGGVEVTVPPEQLDRARTLLEPLVPGRGVLTRSEIDAVSTALLDDVVRGTVITVVGTFLVAATAAGTTAAARVLDQRRSLRLLHLAGTPLAVLDAARRAETLRPLLVLGGIALVLGLLCVSPFAGPVSTLSPGGLAVLGGVLAGGTLLVAAALAASRPLLRSVTQERAAAD